MSDRENARIDTIYGVLSETRRRYVLYYLLDTERATADELARQIAAWERNTSLDSIADDVTTTVLTSLVHNHLPRLASHGIIEYDAQRGDVVVTDEFDEFRETVSRARTVEDESKPASNGREFRNNPVAGSITEE
ncbi:DUF7344 domain-containing protein [Halopiger djelfimassiliensis]|uniref:DUF7344 domain-containing protein n=1 Tax=Halopiger djelfimassiliensis TaxID=1293047 RepID=UPI0006781D04|nr:hypothetical protein [Halopiger djelfimassiliensis]